MKGAVVIIPFHLSWNWPADFMKQTARVVSRNNIVVCYLTHEHIQFRSLLKWSIPNPPVSRISKHLWLVRPVFIIPFERFEIVRKTNHAVNLVVLQMALLARYGVKRKRIFWIFDNTLSFMLRVMFGHFVLYDCVDYVWHPDKVMRRKLQDQERELICRVDVMTVNSHTLYDAHKRKRRDLFVVPLGFRLRECTKKRVVRISLAREKPLVGYIGVIDYRIDFHLLYHLIRKNPQWKFVLWGPENRKVPIGIKPIDDWLRKIHQLPNTIFGMSKNPKDALEIIEQCFVCILPYNASLPIVRYSYPMKVFEYFFAGKPVVSTEIAELRRFPEYIYIGKDPFQWSEIIFTLRTTLWTKKKIIQQRILARNNSWNQKVILIYNDLNASVQ